MVYTAFDFRGGNYGIRVQLTNIVILFLLYILDRLIYSFPLIFQLSFYVSFNNINVFKCDNIFFGNVYFIYVKICLIFLFTFVKFDLMKLINIYVIQIYYVIITNPL